MTDTPAPVSRPEAAPGLPVEPWPSEGWLKALVLVASVLVWGALIASVVGILIAGVVLLVLFCVQLAASAYLRASAVRLGPHQLPELHARVSELARRLGMTDVPAAYLACGSSARGVLARATQLLGSRALVLDADVIEACADDTDARDFILAHALAGLRAGHLDWSWLLLPGRLLPALGSGYARACTYTCDRHAYALARDPERALGALVLLAVGPHRARDVHRASFAAQQSELESLWMKIGHWLCARPPIAHRLAALDPSLARGAARPHGALAFAAAVVLLLMIGVPLAGVTTILTRVSARVAERSLQASASGAATPIPEATRRRVEDSLLSLAAAAEAHRTTEGTLPQSDDILYQTWQRLHPAETEPIDPFDGQRYGYTASEDRYILWSSGPDIEDEADDIMYESPEVPSEASSLPLPEGTPPE